MSSPWKERLADPLFAILTLGFILRLALFTTAAGWPDRFLTPDSREYLALARNPVAGYLDATHDLAATGLRRTPIYPLFSTVFGAKPRAIVAVQLVVGTLLIWLTSRLALALHAADVVRWSALLVAIDPVSVLYTNYVQPEVLFTCTIVCACLCWIRTLHGGTWWWSGLAGLLVGLAALTRPIALYLPLMLLAVGWPLSTGGPRRFAAASALLLGGFLIVAAPWIAHTYAATGVPIVSTIEGKNLLEFRAAGALAESEGISIDDAVRRLRRDLEARTPTGLNPAEFSQRQRSLALETLAHHPWGALKSAAKGAGLLLLGPGRDAILDLLKPGERWGLVLTGLAWIPLAALYLGTLAGVIFWWRSGPRAALAFLLGIIAYFVVMSAGPEAYSRFRVPIVPFFSVLAGYGYARIRREKRFHNSAGG